MVTWSKQYFWLFMLLYRDTIAAAIKKSITGLVTSIFCGCVCVCVWGGFVYVYEYHFCSGFPKPDKII